jgi:spore germination cell wall hydrolase CwlJ-like protein
MENENDTEINLTQIKMNKIRKSKEKEYIADYNEQYYGKNKDKQNETMKTNCKCKVCNCSVKFYKKVLHSKTKKHMNLLEISPYKTMDEIFVRLNENPITK